MHFSSTPKSVSLFKILLKLHLSERFAFQRFSHTEIGDSATTPESFLYKMNTSLNRKQFFGLDTEYIFISLPIIDKAKMMDIIMQKVVKKNNDYRNAISTI